MEKILTIVVPAYNAETCLRDNLESFCIESVLPDIEILVINDGSTDRTQEIAEEYVKQYPDSYRVITKKNGGHGSGINCSGCRRLGGPGSFLPSGGDLETPGCGCGLFRLSVDL